MIFVPELNHYHAGDGESRGHCAQCHDDDVGDKVATVFWTESADYRRSILEMVIGGGGGKSNDRIPVIRWGAVH